MSALLPHVWVQPTGLQTDDGPRVWAGQVMTADGRQAAYPQRAADGRIFSGHVPVRLAPYSKAGLQALAEQLREDINRIEGAA